MIADLGECVCVNTWPKPERVPMIILAILYLSLNGIAQSEREVEVGIDLTPIVYNLIESEFWAFGTEVFVKVANDQSDIRFRLYYNELAIHDDELINRLQVSQSPSFVSISNISRPQSYYGFGIGLARKKMIRKGLLELEWGGDFLLTRFDNIVQSYRHSCNGIDTANCIDIGGSSISLHQTMKSNYFGLGLNPFIGLKRHLGTRLVISIEAGFRADVLVGDHPYLVRVEPLGIDRIEYQSLNQFQIPHQWLITEVGIAIRL